MVKLEWEVWRGFSHIFLLSSGSYHDSTREMVCSISKISMKIPQPLWETWCRVELFQKQENVVGFFFLLFKENFSVFLFVPSVPSLIWYTTEKSLALSLLSFLHHIRYLHMLIRSFLSFSLLQDEQSEFSQHPSTWQMLKYPNNLFGPFLDSVHMSISLPYWKKQHWTWHFKCVSPVLSRE